MKTLLILIFISSLVFSVSGLNIDLSGYQSGEIVVSQSSGELAVEWPMNGSGWGQIIFQPDNSTKLIKEIGISTSGQGSYQSLLSDIEPVFVLNVGDRCGPNSMCDKPVWLRFFDNVADSPFDTYKVERSLTKGTVLSLSSSRVQVVFDSVSAGNFKGSLVFTFYAGSPIFKSEALVTTQDNWKAIVFSGGLAGAQGAGWHDIAYVDSNWDWQTASVGSKTMDSVAMHWRCITADCNNGSVSAMFPPHQVYYADDGSTNRRNAWFGTGYDGVINDFGFGMRVNKDGAYGVWFNAPPGSRQRLSLFYVLSENSHTGALDIIKSYTRGDVYEPIPGYKTSNFHYHAGPKIRTNDYFQVRLKEIGLNIQTPTGKYKERSSNPFSVMEDRFHTAKNCSDDSLLFIQMETECPVATGSYHVGNWGYILSKPVMTAFTNSNQALKHHTYCVYSV